MQDQTSDEYEKEMKIWKTKWAIYKENNHYKRLFDVTQDWMDIKKGKTLGKHENAQKKEEDDSKI